MNISEHILTIFATAIGGAIVQRFTMDNQAIVFCRHDLLELEKIFYDVNNKKMELI